MSREQKTAWYFLACIMLMIILLAILPSFYGERGITVAIMTSALIWMTGFVSITVAGYFRSKKEVTDDERDRLITYKATFAGSMAGYLGLMIGITVIHTQYAMNGVFTLPVDTLYIMFALVLLTFGTVRELAVLVLYQFGDIF